MKYKLNKCYSWFSLPALLLHELSHLISGLFCGYYFNLKESYFSRNSDGSIVFYLWEKNHKKTFIKSLAVSLAPLHLIILIATISIFHPYFCYLLAYQILTIPYSLPSAEDWRKIKYHKVYSKYLNNYEVMVRFFSLKGLYKDEVELEFPLPIDEPE
jgi:hypothetical protein